MNQRMRRPWAATEAVSPGVAAAESGLSSRFHGEMLARAAIVSKPLAGLCRNSILSRVQAIGSQEFHRVYCALPDWALFTVLLRNLGSGTFGDTSAFAGIQRATKPERERPVTWGTAFFDHDNDGWLELYFVSGESEAGGLASALVGNNTDGIFGDISASSGLGDPGRGRNASMVDFDQDGFIDVFVGNYGEAPRLFRNQGAELGSTNNRLTVTVEGTVSNRDGIGSPLTLTTPDGVAQIREITSGGAHGGGEYRAAYFGLGGNTSGDLVVRGPNGVVENIGAVAAGQQLDLVEGP